MEYNPLDNLPLETRQRVDNLPPEIRQRIENALQALGGGVTPQNAPGASGYMPEGAGSGMFPGMNQVFSSQSSTAPTTHTRNSQVWARWEYLADEWARFDQVDWVPVRNTSVLVLLLTPLLSLVVMAALWLRFWPESQVLVLLPGIFLLTLFPWPIVAATVALSRAHKRHLARQDPAQPHRVTFSRDGLWEAGTYFVLHGVLNRGSLKLASVKLTARPMVLHFKLYKRNPDGSPTGLSQTIHVLVPRGNEAEAEQLRQRYDTEVIHWWKKPNNPPEPM